MIESQGRAVIVRKGASIVGVFDSEAKAMDFDPSRSGIFRNHRCWKCNDGEKPCVQGGPHRCEYPRARND